MKLSNNEVTLTGFVGGEPKEKQTGNGKKLTRVSLATTEGRKNRDTGEWTNYTIWHNLVGWGKVAESMASLTKGAYVQVRGSIRNYDMPAKGNSPARQVTKIVVTAFSKLDRCRRGERVPEEEAA